MEPQISYWPSGIDERGLLDILSTLSGNLWVYLEREESVQLSRFSPDHITVHPYGRVFGQEFDLCWYEGEPGRYVVEAMSELTLPLDGFKVVEYELDPLPDEPYTIHLWGAHRRFLATGHRLSSPSERGWVETRIPRLFDYPIDNEPRWVGIQAWDYCIRGITIATRWLELTEFRG